MELKGHTFIIFVRFGITHSIFVIVLDIVMRDESLSVYTPVDVERIKPTLKEKFKHVQQYQYR
jgi:hypothetical protein